MDAAKLRVTLFALLLIACAQAAPPQTPTKSNRPVTPREPRATWNESAEKYFGITEQGFLKMGLSSLTEKQYSEVLTWAIGRELSAREEGRQKGMQDARASMLVYECGRRASSDASSYEKVHLMLLMPDEFPTELASGIRQKLRNIADVKIVFDEASADVVVSFLGYENKTESSNRLLGYSISVLTAESCEWKIGTTSGRSRTVLNHYVQTGPHNANSATEEVVTTLDAHDIETARRSNASMRQILEKSKPPKD